MPPAAARLSPSAHVDTFTRDHLPPARPVAGDRVHHARTAYPDRLNAAAELIDVPAETFGADRPALRTPDGETWTYGELRTRANQVAQVLTEDLGLVPGQRVLLRSPNNPWTVAAWLGVLKAGGVVVTTMAALRARELGADRRAHPAVRRARRPPLRRGRPRRPGHRAAVPDGDRLRRRRTGRPDRPGRRQVGRVRRRGHRRRRRGAARPDLGQHRGPEDHHALPPRHPVDRQHVRPAHAPAGAGRRGGLHARRSPSPSASACWSSSRCGPAPARC